MHAEDESCMSVRDAYIFIQINIIIKDDESKNKS